MDAFSTKTDNLKLEVYNRVRIMSKALYVYKDISELEELYKKEEQLGEEICRLKVGSIYQKAVKDELVRLSSQFLDIHRMMIHTEKTLIYLKDKSNE